MSGGHVTASPFNPPPEMRAMRAAAEAPMRMILAVLLLCTLVLAPYQIVFESASADHGKPFPWKTFSESVKFSVGAHIGACRIGGVDKEVIAAVLMQGETMWSYFFAPDTERFVFAEMGPNGMPVRIWSGKADLKAPAPKHDELVISEHHVYARERDGDGPCKMLFPDGV